MADEEEAPGSAARANNLLETLRREADVTNRKEIRWQPSGDGIFFTDCSGLSKRFKLKMCRGGLEKGPSHRTTNNRTEGVFNTKFQHYWRYTKGDLTRENVEDDRKKQRATKCQRVGPAAVTPSPVAPAAVAPSASESQSPEFNQLEKLFPWEEIARSSFATSSDYCDLGEGVSLGELDVCHGDGGRGVAAKSSRKNKRKDPPRAINIVNEDPLACGEVNGKKRAAENSVSPSKSHRFWSAFHQLLEAHFQYCQRSPYYGERVEWSVATEAFEQFADQLHHMLQAFVVQPLPQNRRADDLFQDVESFVQHGFVKSVPREMQLPTPPPSSQLEEAACLYSANKIELMSTLQDLLFAFSVSETENEKGKVTATTEAAVETLSSHLELAHKMFFCGHSRQPQRHGGGGFDGGNDDDDDDNHNGSNNSGGMGDRKHSDGGSNKKEKHSPDHIEEGTRGGAALSRGVRQTGHETHPVSSPPRNLTNLLITFAKNLCQFADDDSYANVCWGPENGGIIVKDVRLMENYEAFSYFMRMCGFENVDGGESLIAGDGISALSLEHTVDNKGNHGTDSKSLAVGAGGELTETLRKMQVTDSDEVVFVSSESGMQQETAPPTRASFPERLREYADDENVPEIGWQAGGDGIIVKDLAKVQTYWKSFTRIMYDWGFQRGLSPQTRRVSSSRKKAKHEDYWYHKEQLFTRDDNLQLQRTMRTKRKARHCSPTRETKGKLSHDTFQTDSLETTRTNGISETNETHLLRTEDLLEIGEGETEVWNATFWPSMSTSRMSFAAVMLREEGKIVVMGGEEDVGLGMSMSSVESIFPCHSKWGTTAAWKMPPLARPRSAFGAAIVTTRLATTSATTSIEGSDSPPPQQQCRHIVVAGGWIDNRPAESAEVFNLSTNQWTDLPPLQVKRHGCAVTSLYSSNIVRGNDGGRVYVVGGHDGSGVVHHSVEWLDVSAALHSGWRYLPSKMKRGRIDCAAVMVESSEVEGDASWLPMVVVLGGWTRKEKITSSVECFDSGEWRDLPRMTTRRVGCAAVAMGRRIFVVGGTDASLHPLATAEYFDFGTNCWTRLAATMSVPRKGCAAVVVTENGNGNHDDVDKDDKNGDNVCHGLVVLGGRDGKRNETHSSVEVLEIRQAHVAKQHHQQYSKPPTTSPPPIDDL